MIQHIELLVEEPSMEAVLRVVVPRIIPGVSFEVRVFNGKPDLLAKLPDRLKGYRDWSHVGGLGVVVIVDRDNDDCVTLLGNLNATGQRHGYSLCSLTQAIQGTLLNRLVVEELEAWFLGDVPAMATAFPGVPTTLRSRSTFRDPDAVRGGTAEAFGRVLRQAGHHTNGLRKIAAASEISPHLHVEKNDSNSFVKFRDGLRMLVNGAM